MEPPPEKITSPTSPETRIITHLNNDHQRELSHYLRHYAGVSALESLNPLLISITFTSMKIRTASGKTYDIPVDPPMQTWADARIRAVDMDKTARSALGIEDVYVDRYILPSKPSHLVVFILSALNLVQLAAYYSGLLEPGSFLYKEVLQRWPRGGADGYLWIIQKIGIPVVFIHIAEAIMFDRLRMRGGKYGIVRGTRLWWIWVGGQFLEGFGNMFRFDAEIARKRKEKEGKKH